MKLALSRPWRSRSASHALSPGKGAALPRPPPLGTGHDSFPSSGSSLSVAPRGTRFHHGQPLTMHLAMAVGMEQHLIVSPVAAALDPPDQVMEVPACVGGDGLVADQAV